MAKIPENRCSIPAGKESDMLADACRQCAAEQAGLLDWLVTAEKVAVILADGRKVAFDVAPAGAARAVEPVEVIRKIVRRGKK